MTPPIGEPRLTSLAHGGGCGCKISPLVLKRLLKSVPAHAPIPDLLVGAETSDDAAVWRLDDERCLIATTDFFMPVVDDPFDFGRIAATNALSDVFAMGGRPLFALALTAMPVGQLSEGTIAEILRGGAAACAGAGTPIVGGHSIDSVEPIYGLAVVGMAARAHMLTNRGLRPGDRLILTKPLGVGVLSAAVKQGIASADDYQALIETTTQLNAVGADLGGREGIHAMTDVTGFGLLGHLREMADGSGVAIDIDEDRVPILPQALALAREGVRTGASARNMDSLKDRLDPETPLDSLTATLLCDPQTSGGLLIGVSQAAAEETLARVRAAGFASAAVIGGAIAGEPRLRVRSQRR